jgi:hypothetical protein
MQTTTSSVHRHPPKPPTTKTPPPSVPLYVYRELATELKSTQAKMDALTAHNQQLQQENELLRQEITKVAQSFIHLQKLVDSHPQPSSPKNVQPNHEVKSSAKQPVTEVRPPQKPPLQRSPVVKEAPTSKNHNSSFSVPVEDINYPMPETIYIEEQEVRYYSPTETKVKEFSGWWLAITILLIMLTAFGAGYFIVRPLFEHQNR